MNADEMYDGMKRALKSFDLDWKDRDKIEVIPSNGEIRFQYGNKAYVVGTPVRTDRTSMRLWSKNPCRLKNTRGHSGCPVCDVWSEEIFKRRMSRL